MPGRCGMPLARRWPIPSHRVGARATPVRPAEATSWSWSASIARRTTGRWPVSSSATCVWTTTCLFTISARPATSRRRAWCATCSTRPSTRIGRWSRKSRFGVTRRPGSRSSEIFRAFISKARNIDGRTTGRSGAGTASRLARTSNWHANPRRVLEARHVRRDHPRHPRHVPWGDPEAGAGAFGAARVRPAAVARMLPRRAAHAQPGSTARDLAIHADPAAHCDRLTLAEASSRSGLFAGGGS